MEIECTLCNKVKNISEFEKRSDTQKYRKQCKSCRNEYVRNYKVEIATGTRTKFVPYIIDGKKQCSKCNIIKDLTDFPKRDTEHGYRHECKQCKQEQLLLYYQSTYNEVRRNKKKEDIVYRLVCNHRNYVYKCLTKYNNKKGSSVSYIGCSLTTLKMWLEYQFDSNMSWENYGTYWTVDHILPLALFEFPSQADIAFNWKNMQPLHDNFQKGKKIRLYEFFNSIISLHRFMKHYNLNEYQGVRNSLHWLSEKLRYGKNLLDDSFDKIILTKLEIGNPQPSRENP